MEVKPEKENGPGPAKINSETPIQPKAAPTGAPPKFQNRAENSSGGPNHGGGGNQNQNLKRNKNFQNNRGKNNNYQGPNNRGPMKNEVI